MKNYSKPQVTIDLEEYQFLLDIHEKFKNSETQVYRKAMGDLLIFCYQNGYSNIQSLVENRFSKIGLKAIFSKINEELIVDIVKVDS